MSDILREREAILRFSEDPNDLMVFETFNRKQAERLIRSGATIKRAFKGGRGGGKPYWTLEMPREWFRYPRKPSASRAEASRRAVAARGGIVGRKTDQEAT